MMTEVFVVAVSSDEGDLHISNQIAYDDYHVTVDDLIHAAGFGKLEDVKTIVNKYGVDVNGLGSDRKLTPIVIASYKGHTDVVRFLIESGSHVNKLEDPELAKHMHRAPIHYACFGGFRDIVELLLSNGAKLHDTDSQGNAPIHIACKNGDVELVNFLLDSGASVNDRNGDMYTPLMTAVHHGQYETVLFLLGKGATVNHCPESQNSPLQVACVKGRNDIALTLLAHGASATEYDLSRKSPLFRACLFGHNDVLLTLLAHGVQVRGRDFLDWNPLHPACSEGHYKVVQTLLKNGVNTHSYDEEGLSPLHNVCVLPQCRSEDVLHPDPTLQPTYKGYTLKILLEYGINPNVLDKRGLTVFESMCDDHYLYCGIDNRMLTILLDYGTGSGVLCRGKKCNRKTTALMCIYSFSRAIIISMRSLGYADSVDCQSLPNRDTYEMYFIKTRTAGINASPNEKAPEPPLEGVDWDLSKREAYQAECEAELRHMKSHTIGETSATYLNLLTRNLPALRYQKILGQLTGDGCVRSYPIYGNMIFCSYARLRRTFLEEEGPEFFSITSTPLPLDCAEAVQRYLSDEDLKNIVDVYRTYQLYLRKL